MHIPVASVTCIVDAPVTLAAFPGDDDSLSDMAECAQEASEFLKALGHEVRLLILCHLMNGEKSVSELEKLLSMRQPAVSQQLMRLRLEGYVDTRRDGKAIYYSIKDERVKKMVEFLYDIFC